MSKFSRHTSAKKSRKFTHQITVTTPTLSAVQCDAWGCNELNRCMLGSIFEMATRSSRLGKKLNINLVPTANMAYSLWQDFPNFFARDPFESFEIIRDPSRLK